MIIDAHAHIYPDKIAQNAVKGISDFYEMPVMLDGTVQGLLKAGDEAGVSHFIVQSVATVHEQVQSINNFIAKSVEQYPDRLIGFGTLHPDFPDIKSEISRMKQLGLRGIKLHPDFQRYYLDDEKAFPMYEQAEENSLSILFHIGDPRFDFSSPERLLNVVRRFPKLVVIGAHLCGWSLWDKTIRWDRAEELFSHSTVYADCSSSFYALSPEEAAEFIRKIGTHRVLWGTDYPMWNAKDELQRFSELSLTEDERRDILGLNALRLLGEIR